MDDHRFPPVKTSSIPSDRDRDMVRLEVFDHDYVSQNDFLGHVEMSKDRLAALAVITEGQAIEVPLTMKEHRGVLSLQIGFNADEGDGGVLGLQVVGAEGLDPVNPRDLSNPYAKVWLLSNTGGAGEVLIGTTAVVFNTVRPQWGSIFRLM